MKKLRKVCIIIGIIFLIFSVETFKESRDFKSRSKKTTATITGVDRRGSRKRGYEYVVDLEYEVDGKLVEDRVTYKSYKSVGRTVTIWYDTDNPSHASKNNMSYRGPITLALIAIAFLYYGVERLFRKPEEQDSDEGDS